MSQKDRKMVGRSGHRLVLVALCIALWRTGLLERLKNVGSCKPISSLSHPLVAAHLLRPPTVQRHHRPHPQQHHCCRKLAPALGFGWFLITLVAVLVGSCTTFTLARTLCKNFADRVIRPKLSPKYLELLDRKRDTFLALAFFFPLFPDDLLCIMAGLDRDPLPPLLHHRPADPTVGIAGGQHLRQLPLLLLPQGHPAAGHRRGTVHRGDDLRGSY